MGGEHVRCWICGAPGNSAEHIIKASDLRLLFGKVHQGSPLYLNSGDERNHVIRGLKSDILKSPAKLCSDCNNARSAPYDRAWQMMSEHILGRLRQGHSFSRLDIKHVFPATRRPPGTSSREMATRAQLYFVKLWGTRLAEVQPEHALLPGFAAAFLEGRSHPHVYFAVKLDENTRSPRIASCTDFHGVQAHSTLQYMTWGYGLGRLFFQLYYSPDRFRIRGRPWHPSDPGRFIPVQLGYG